MKYKVKDLVKIFDKAEVEGDVEVKVSSIAALDKAEKGDLSFLGNKKYAPQVENTKASAVLLPRKYNGKIPENCTAIRVDNPSAELAKICAEIEKVLLPRPEAAIHPAAVIDRDAILGENVFIGPNVVICAGAEIAEGAILYANNYVGRFAKIGKNAILMPNSVVMEHCEIGEGSRLQAGAVIGSDGYGYEFVNGVHVRVPQVGKVVIGKDVDIGANTCIDRARFDKTVIGDGTKVDNLVQVGHNVETGQGCLLVSQVGISGSTKLGNYCVLGGQVGVAGHLKIGDGAMIGGQSGVNGDIDAGAYMRGTPPRPYMKAHKIEILIGHLPDLYDRVKDLEKNLGIEKKVFKK